MPKKQKIAALPMLGNDETEFGRQLRAIGDKVNELDRRLAVIEEKVSDLAEQFNEEFGEEIADEKEPEE